MRLISNDNERRAPGRSRNAALGWWRRARPTVRGRTVPLDRGGARTSKGRDGSTGAVRVSHHNFGFRPEIAHDFIALV
jgi:hypothetical protein